MNVTFRLPSDEVLSHRTPRQFDKTLSALGRKNLGDWYASDIASYEEFVTLRKEWFGLPAAPGTQRRIS